MYWNIPSTTCCQKPLISKFFDRSQFGLSCGSRMKVSNVINVRNEVFLIKQILFSKYVGIY